jgi:hypothetical protein
MTILIGSFIEQLLLSAAATSNDSCCPSITNGGAMATCQIVSDNAIMPTRSLRKLQHKAQNRTAVNRPSSRPGFHRSYSLNYCSRDESGEDDVIAAVRAPRKSTSSINLKPKMRGYPPRSASSSFSRLSSKKRTEDDDTLSPTSVLEPSLFKIDDSLPPASPRSARWTATGRTPLQTLMKLSSSPSSVIDGMGLLRRLESDSALICPKRSLLISPVSKSSSSHNSRRSVSSVFLQSPIMGVGSQQTSMGQAAESTRNFNWEMPY